MTDKDIETEIQAKGLTAPRILPSDVDFNIVDETYTTMPSGKVMVCELTLRSGFTVRGEAATVSKENFNEEIGRKISRENARNKIWELMGYELQCRLARGDLNGFEMTEKALKTLLEACEKVSKVMSEAGDWPDTLQELEALHKAVTELRFAMPNKEAA